MTTRFIGCLGPLPGARLSRPLTLPLGEAYGGGLRARAASQSKGTEDEIDGVSAGERCSPKLRRLRGVVGRPCGEPAGEAKAEDLGRGEPSAVEAWFV